MNGNFLSGKIILYVASVFILGCTKDATLIKFQIGNDLLHVGSGVSICDTFSVELSTVQTDSMITSGQESMLIGHLNDERLGTLTARAFFRLSTPVSVPVKEGDVYDSIGLVVKLNGYYFGDTTIVQNWNVGFVSDEIQAHDDGYLYNTSQFNCYEEPMGSISFKVYPSLNQEIVIPLNHEFGENLFNTLIYNYSDISSADEFHEFLKGIVIEPANPAGNTVLGVNTQDTSVILRLYTHRYEEELVELKTNFLLETGSLPFTQISYNRQNSMVQSIKSGKVHLSSTLTDNESYLQGGSGLITRIDIPSLARVLELEHMALLKAELLLTPVLGSYQTENLPENLIFSRCDKNNKILTTYTDNTTGDYLYGPLLVNDLSYNESTYYKLDITQYIYDELGDNFFESGTSGMLVTYNDPDFQVTANHVVFGNAYHPKQKSKLKLYFLYYE
ncbi:MAG: DUF4270 family protein [Bacteroidales bacterium]